MTPDIEGARERVGKYLAERQKMRGLDEQEIHSIQAGSSRYAAILVADVATLLAEVERLTACLKTANSNHEEFERKYYLEQQENERLPAWKEAVEQAEVWQPIETAPMDGTELIGWRDDYGPLLIRWTSCSELMTDAEIEQSGIDEETLFAEDWFYADIVRGGRLEGSEKPTHWMPLPPDPLIARPSKEPQA